MLRYGVSGMVRGDGRCVWPLMTELAVGNPLILQISVPFEHYVFGECCAVVILYMEFHRNKTTEAQKHFHEDPCTRSCYCYSHTRVTLHSQNMQCLNGTEICSIWSSWYTDLTKRKSATATVLTTLLQSSSRQPSKQFLNSQFTSGCVQTWSTLGLCS